MGFKMHLCMHLHLGSVVPCAHEHSNVDTATHSLQRGGASSTGIDLNTMCSHTLSHVILPEPRETSKYQFYLQFTDMDPRLWRLSVWPKLTQEELGVKPWSQDSRAYILSLKFPYPCCPNYLVKNIGRH